MFKSFLVTVLNLSFLFAAANVFAEDLSSAEKAKIRNQAQNFYLKQAAQEQWSSQSRALFGAQQLEVSQNRCDDDEQDGRISCISELCKTTHCSGSSGREIAEACRGSNGRCVQELCKTTHCSGSSGKEIASACRGSSGLCVEELCKTTHCSGSSGKEIAEACRGSDGECVIELCKTSHCSGSTGKEIARTCGGH